MSLDPNAIRRRAAYKRLLESILNALPMCADPFGWHGKNPRPASQVHHIRGMQMHPELAMVRGNLAPLCYTCHKQIERSPDTRRVFEACIRLANAYNQPEIASEYMRQWQEYQNAS